MGGLKMIYFDNVSPEIKNIMLDRKPAGSQLLFWHELAEQEKYEELSRAEILLVSAARLDQEMLVRAKNTKFIQKMGIGLDNIDLTAVKELNIPLSYTPGANAVGVAELTILLILALYRKLTVVNTGVKHGEWLPWKIRPHSYEMYGKTHGIIGFGSIGRETAKRSKAFGTEIIYYNTCRGDPKLESELQASYCPLEELLRRSDIISIHVPLSAQTRGLIGENEIALMKPTAVLINVARGGIVDENSLLQALQSGQLSGAGIDVWEKEPVDRDNPLLQLENVIATSHIGAATRDTFHRVLDVVFENIKRLESGIEPLHLVKKET